PLDLLSFPTRRSSDLAARRGRTARRCGPAQTTRAVDRLVVRDEHVVGHGVVLVLAQLTLEASPALARGRDREALLAAVRVLVPRSEEHTSELQSRENL